MTAKYLESPRWVGGPHICSIVNLPAFETEREAQAFNDAHGHLPVMVRWRCKACGGWHHWTTAPTDSNGAYKAGAEAVPSRISKLAIGWGMKETA